jgi:hypothetical protein
MAASAKAAYCEIREGRAQYGRRAAATYKGLGMNSTFASAALAAALMAWSFTAMAALKKEPVLGALKEGQIVYVDDGTCRVAQIKKVIGGNHVKVGGTQRTERTRTCVPR